MIYFPLQYWKSQSLTCSLFLEFKITEHLEHWRFKIRTQFALRWNGWTHEVQIGLKRMIKCTSIFIIYCFIWTSFTLCFIWTERPYSAKLKEVVFYPSGSFSITDIAKKKKKKTPAISLSFLLISLLWVRDKIRGGMCFPVPR